MERGAPYASPLTLWSGGPIQHAGKGGAMNLAPVEK